MSVSWEDCRLNWAEEQEAPMRFYINHSQMSVSWDPRDCDPQPSRIDLMRENTALKADNARLREEVRTLKEKVRRRRIAHIEEHTGWINKETER